jgi:hypothetical protein
LSLTFQEKVRGLKTRSRLPKIDYHCHISMTEYTDPGHLTRLSVSKEEFLADLQEVGIVARDARESLGRCGYLSRGGFKVREAGCLHVHRLRLR